MQHVEPPALCYLKSIYQILEQFDLSQTTEYLSLTV